MAPLPVMPPHSVVLPLVGPIGPMPFHKVPPVSAVFAIIPIVVIAMVPIVDSHLDAAVLRIWASNGDGWCSKSGEQRQRTKNAIEVTHDVLLYAGDTA